MEKISRITENFGVLLNHFFLKNNKSRESTVVIENAKQFHKEMK